MSLRRSLLASFALLPLAAWWGCAKSSNSLQTGGSSTISATTGGGGSGAGSTGTGAVDGGSDADGDAAACVPKGLAAHQPPLDLVFVVDQSSGMAGTNWTAVTNVLPAFFNDKASAGVGVGLVLYPYAPNDCNVAHYKSLTVPIGLLPDNAMLLTSSLPPNAAGVNTPMYAALQGALMAATADQDANPGRTVAVVLVTDEDPDVCDVDGGDIAGLASSALGYDGVRTFVVGLPGVPIADLNSVAAAGGTAAIYDDSINLSLFPTSLAQIRAAGLGCGFVIPPPPMSQKLVPDEVNVSYTPKGMGNPIVLLREKNLAGCNGQPGWYYDDDTAPTKIILCPASCSAVQADTAAVVDVLFGCPSM